MDRTCQVCSTLSCALRVQTMDPARQLDYSFDPLDPTKAGSDQPLCFRAIALSQQPHSGPTLLIRSNKAAFHHPVCSLDIPHDFWTGQTPSLDVRRHADPSMASESAQSAEWRSTEQQSVGADMARGKFPNAARGTDDLEPEHWQLFQ